MILKVNNLPKVGLNNESILEIRETTGESQVSQPEQMSKSKMVTPQTSSRANQVNMLINKSKEALGAQQFEQVHFFRFNISNNSQRLIII